MVYNSLYEEVFICSYDHIREERIFMKKRKADNGLPVNAENLLRAEKIASKENIEKHENKIWRMVEFFIALSDPTRVKILLLLMDGEKCVGRLAEDLGMSSSRVSHQLRILRHLKLVERRKEGKFIRYSLADEHVIEVLNVAFHHAAECMEV